MSAPINQSIPFIAGGSTWDSWNGNMLHYFGQEPLPYVPESEWQQFADVMVGLPTFASYGIPGPNGFGSWQEWVSSVIGMVNGPTE
jgi:hypothetical protein